MLTLLSVALAQTPPATPAPPATPPAAAPAPAPVGPPTEAVIRAEVDKAYGKHVPEAAVCVARPTLDAPFHGHPTAVGVRQAAKGCVLYGVMVDGVWLDPANALPAAVDRAAWDALPPADRNTRILQWTDGVLLAFDRPSASVPGKVVPSSKGFTVERRMFRRVDRTGGVNDLTEKSTFDTKLVRTAATSQVHGDYTSNLLMRPEKVTGLSEAVVEQALTSKGKVIRDCFTAAWEADPAITGRVVLGWNVAAGKVDPNVAVVAMPGETPNDSLAKCYATHIRSAAYPPEATGTATWVFWVDRRTETAAK